MACDALDARWRVRALAIDDTEERLEHALSGLDALKAKLGAEVAVRRALVQPVDDADMV